MASLNSATNKLHYGMYAEHNEVEKEQIIPDFSYAGYKGGGVALPLLASIPVRETLSPATTGDDTGRIQAAIDRVAQLPLDENGFRGVVLLQAGRYRTSASLIIPSSGIVIRGEGRSDSGTVIRLSSNESKDAVIEAIARSDSRPRRVSGTSEATITSSNNRVGSHQLSLSTTEDFTEGDHIVILRQPNDFWLGPNGIDTSQYGWTSSSYRIAFERKITAIEGNVIYIDIPLVDSIAAEFGGGVVYKADLSERIEHIGVEQLRVEGNPDTGVVNGTSTDAPFAGVVFGWVQHSWVRDVTARYLSHAVATKHGAHFNTFQDLSYLDPRFGVTQGSMRYVFVIEGNSSSNLFQRCYGENARHTFITGSRVPGPNVYLDCLAVNANNDSGPHQRWAVGTLYDNTKGYQLRVQNRRTSGSGHGWAGGQIMLWNTEHEEYVLQAPSGGMNWSVGQKGLVVPGQWEPEEPSGILESVGTPVSVRSLYLQQLKDRLGEQAVINITTQAQRDGRIWDDLAADKNN